MSKFPETETLELELKQGWLTIWFNQPENRNALSDALVAELASVLKSVRDDRAVRGITLRGRGGVFCAGADLKNFKENFQKSGDRAAIIKMSSGAAEIFDLVNSAPQVVIVLIEGAAMAGGFGLSCCADVVICESGARFAMTETAIGVSPAQISPFVIQKLGYATGRRLMLTAARFDGAEAHKLGFADFIADDVAGLEAIEMQLRKQVLGAAPGAVAATKELLGQIAGKPRHEVIRLAAENFADRMVSDEAKEGVASFFEKRKPIGW
ncbi:enoyl-CoA hydratase [Sphingopyxis sp. BSNA05]|uniref:enoyl-CoA hydratase/isomerase family protein n=1 Tax=Sphingopyxis sp. BSNA05 TaxID=1236614 RepID=UPI0015664C05|nr:enoyl-CoA hydratase-related protein [Sphingopyxis sp. BSNA05]NRD89996.1 enoyl-CoA hydratase [Sphingopyxis sp. BSNA05]